MPVRVPAIGILSTLILKDTPKTIPVYGVTCTNTGILIALGYAKDKLFAVNIASGEVERIASDFGSSQPVGLALSEVDRILYVSYSHQIIGVELPNRYFQD